MPFDPEDTYSGPPVEGGQGRDRNSLRRDAAMLALTVFIWIALLAIIALLAVVDGCGGAS